MAKHGRRPPGDLRSTLGSLVASALEQMGTVREVVERGAQAQRSRYDSVKLDRQRRDALAALGEVVHRMAVRGRLGALGDDPEVRAQLEEIDGIEQRIESAGQAERGGFAVNSGWGSGERARAPRRRGPDGEVRVWRPVPAFAAPDAEDELDESGAGAAAEPQAAAEPARKPLTGRGISFGDDWDDDEDLEEYMCDDDVPAPSQAAAAEEPAAREAEAEAAEEAEAPKPKAKPRKRRTAKRSSK